MKSIKFLLLALICIFTVNCKKNVDYEDPHFKFPNYKNVSEELKLKDLYFPSGLSQKNNVKKSWLAIENKGSEIDGIYIETPVYRNLRGLGGIVPYQNPRISQFSGTQEEILVSTVGEIDLDVFTPDFDSYDYVGHWIILGQNDSLWRAKGLTLDCIALNNGNILTSSSSSDKIFRINEHGESEIFLQNDELIRITDIVEGSNNKIYAVKAPTINNQVSPKVVYPKSVISIYNGSINTEFELPSNMPYESYDEYTAIFDKLKIVENSNIGKRKYGTQFYISDLFENVIYKIDSLKNVSVLTRNLRFPSSLAVDSLGTVYYTSSPILGNSADYRELAFKVSIYAINPETGVQKLLHTFNEGTYDYITGEYYPVNLPGETVKRYDLIVDFNVTNTLYESRNKLTFIFSNSHQGTLRVVQIEK